MSRMRVPVCARVVYDEHGIVMPLAYHLGNECWVAVEAVQRVKDVRDSKRAENAISFLVRAEGRMQTLRLDLETGIWTIDAPEGACAFPRDDESC